MNILDSSMIFVTKEDVGLVFKFFSSGGER